MAILHCMTAPHLQAFSSQFGYVPIELNRQKFDRLCHLSDSAPQVKNAAATKQSSTCTVLSSCIVTIQWLAGVWQNCGCAVCFYHSWPSVWKHPLWLSIEKLIKPFMFHLYFHHLWFNIQQWSDLFTRIKRPFLLENCHILSIDSNLHNGFITLFRFKTWCG